MNASIGQWPHGHARDSAVRICAAMHEHLLLLDVNDGAADAQVEPTRLRSKRFAKIGVAEPVDALLWRDQHLCVAHPGCYVVLDAASGTEIWRVHLSSPGQALRRTTAERATALPATTAATATVALYKIVIAGA